MRFTYDLAVDALHITVRDSPSVLRTEETSSGVHVDLDEDGHVCGIEILAASSHADWDMTGLVWRYSLDINTAAFLIVLEERRSLFRFR